VEPCFHPDSYGYRPARHTDLRLRELRLYFQHASEKEFIGAVEQITGRKVRAFTSAIDTHVDVSTEAFYFEPVGSPLGHGPERDEELSP